MQNTLDLESLFHSLLRDKPQLAELVKRCKITFAPSPEWYNYCTQINIAVPNKLQKRLQARINEIIASMHPIPMMVNFTEDGKVVSSKPEDIQSQVVKYTKPMLTREKTIPQTIPATEMQESNVDLNGIQEPMRTMIRGQIISLHLPVYLEDEGYQIPKSTFVTAWNSLGEALLGNGEFFFEPEISSQQTTVGVTQDAGSESTTGDKVKKRIVLMYPALKPEEIIPSLKPADIRKTVDVVLGRVNKAVLATDEDTITAIVTQSELGKKLLQKIITAYHKADEAYKQAELSDKLTKKIIGQCKKWLTSTQA